MKKFVAVLICVAMLLCAGVTNAFAYEIGDVISWEFYSEGFTDTFDVTYAGKLEEGVNKIGNYDGEDSYFGLAYEFDAEKSGYYKVSYSEEDIWCEVSKTYENSIPAEYNESIYTYVDGGTEKVMYFEEGTSLVAVDYYNSNSELSIEYFAESMTDVQYDESIFEDLVIGYEIDPQNGKFEHIFDDCSVTFSNGETIEITEDNSLYVCGEYEGEFTEGENIVVFDFLNTEIEQTVTAYEITNYIESIELENVDDYLTVYSYYDGSIDCSEYNENITINYADGTSETKLYSYYGDDCFVTLPNGRDYYIGISYDFERSEDDRDLERIVFYAAIGNHRYFEKECECVDVSNSQNFKYYLDAIEWLCQYFVEDIGYIYSNLLEQEGFENALDWMYEFVECFYDFTQELIEETVELLNYIAR